MAPKNVVIIGAGIVGTCSAYYTAVSSARPDDMTITLVEATGVASGASGKAGGFLAKDWHPTATASMSALSYDLHSTLAKQFGGQAWGYRQVDTFSITTDSSAKSAKPSPVPWVREGIVISHRVLGDTTTNAQVHPRLFTERIHKEFLSQPRTSFIIGSAKSLEFGTDGKPSKLIVEQQSGDSESSTMTTTEIPVDEVVICAGPWTGKLAKELLGDKVGKQASVTGSRAHSIILKTKETLTAHALFTDMTMDGAEAGEPEVYARPDGTCYICGGSDSEPLPAKSSDVHPSPKAISTLHRQAESLSQVFEKDQVEIIAEQACYLPIAERGRPIIGKIKGFDGVWVNAGHSCWGITQGPGSGLLLSELLLEGKAKSADISRLLPTR